MKSLKTLGMLCAGGLLVACASGDPGANGADHLDSTKDTILRPTAIGGRDQVVMVYAKVIVNGAIGTRTCTGSYFAPRVVLTAAHCLTNVFVDQMFVYFGDDFATDVNELTVQGATLIPPPPGSPSHWSKADSFETHPQYDANLNYPDMGVIYMDRKPPFDPLPLYRSRLDNSFLNKVVTIMGWGANSAPTPTTGAGGQIERTGKTTFLGSPTAADYHADDPNPGMLNATVRNNTFKLDGRAPNSNPCFGDSGGPTIINQYGQDYIAGVGFWVGLSCENYTIFSRLEPFLPFLDQAYKKGGQETLIPSLDCVAPNPSGSLTAYFDYTNKNGVALTVPYGTKNQLALDTLGWRPTAFAPGEHDFVFGVDFGVNQTLTYSLAPDNSPRTTINVTKNSPRCGADKASQVECGNACRAQERSGCPNMPSFSTCLAGCVENNEFFANVYPDCADELSALNTCYATVPPGTQNWTCFDGSVPDSPACSSQVDAFITCLYY